MHSGKIDIAIFFAMVLFFVVKLQCENSKMWDPCNDVDFFFSGINSDQLKWSKRS